MFSYSTHKWKHLAAGILRRDGYRCQVSKRYGKQVPAEVVHHIYLLFFANCVYAVGNGTSWLFYVSAALTGIVFFLDVWEVIRHVRK